MDLFDKQITRSPEETVKFGTRLGKRLRSGDILLLSGPVGSGKTCFVKGVARGMGLRVHPSEVVSPTFVLIKEYPCQMPLYHIDLYRLDRWSQNDRLLIDECFLSEGVTAVEWAEKLSHPYPDAYLRIVFKHRSEESREIRLEPVGDFRFND